MYAYLIVIHNRKQRLFAVAAPNLLLPPRLVPEPVPAEADGWGTAAAAGGVFAPAAAAGADVEPAVRRDQLITGVPTTQWRIGAIRKNG